MTRLRLPLLLFLLAIPAVASATTIPLAGDATINQNAPNTNYGATANLVVNQLNQALVEFPLGTLPAGTTAAQVSKATLTIYVNRVNAPGGIIAVGYTRPFVESTVTYNSSLSTTATFLGPQSSNTPVAQTAGTFIALDVTAYVQNLITNGFTEAVMLVGNSDGKADIRLDSKENDSTAHPATLDVTLVNQGSQGIQGVQGPQGVAGPQGPQGTAGTNGATGVSSLPDEINLVTDYNSLAVNGAGDVGYTNLTSNGAFYTPSNENYTVVTIPTTGVYLYSFSFIAQNNVSLILSYNGTTTDTFHSQPTAARTPNGGGPASMTGIMIYNAGDKVTLRNNSSLPITLDSGGTPTNGQVVPCATLTFVHLN